MKNTTVTTLGATLSAAHRHYNLGGDDTTLIAVADATGTAFESGELVGSLERTYFTVLLFDGAGDPVTTSAGSIQVQGKAGIDAHWQDVANGTFDANTVADSTRVQPGASGPLRYWRVLLTGTTLATHFSAYVDKY